MRLIAESGSTKTDWVFLEKGKDPQGFSSRGMHPSFHTEAELSIILQDTFEVELHPTEIYFYGAGCASDLNQNKIKESLNKQFPSAKTIVIESDLLGASRSIYGTESGITCILGTGSNACFYDGKNNHKNFPSLGYILGDEGSGSDIGKRFLKANFSSKLPTDISLLVEKEFGSLEIILETLNNGNQPNRYLASFAKLVSEHKNIPAIHKLVRDSFKEFIVNQIKIYPESNLFPIGFVGSISNYFKEELREEMDQHKLEISQIVPSPIDGLIKFHSI